MYTSLMLIININLTKSYCMPSIKISARLVILLHCHSVFMHNKSA